MGHCLSCNAILSVAEDKRKSAVTGDEFCLCNVCLGNIALEIPDSLAEDDPIWDEISELDNLPWEA